MKTFGCCSLFALLASGALAQNPLAASQKGFFDIVAHNIVAAAEEMPEENYGFKPTGDVRSFGQLIGHVADSEYGFCSMIAGEKPPIAGSFEQTKTSKADLVQAVKDSTAYCDKVYAGFTDAQAVALVSFMGHNIPKLTVVSINTAHTDEHYGNIVTYLRLKGLVPPSSQKQ